MSFKFSVTTEQPNGSADFVATATVEGIESAKVAIPADHPLYADFAQFGFKTHIRNTFAMSKEAKEGMTPEEAFDLLSKRLARYDEGEWNLEREAGEAQPSGGLLAQALANLSGKSLAEVRTYLAALGSDEKERAKIHSKIRERDDVAEEITRIKRERNKNKPQADLSALGL